jgi:hypothetical protein
MGKIFRLPSAYRSKAPLGVFNQFCRWMQFTKKLTSWDFAVRDVQIAGRLARKPQLSNLNLISSPDELSNRVRT